MKRKQKIDKLIKERTINIHDAIKYIKEIQNSSFDRYDILDEIPLGEIAKAKWDDSMFSYGMEYGAIYALMKLFNIRKEEL